MPLTTDIQKNVKILEKENSQKPKNKKRSQAQIMAIAHQAARRQKIKQSR